jgi:Fe2+ or Zn2+ uptake regulation protein
MIITANIVRPTVTANFTVLPNALLEYNRHTPGLKPRDIAVLNYLLSKPAMWKIRAQDIANAINIGKSTVYKALRQLQDFGFASYTRDKKGFTSWIVSCPEKLCKSDISAHVKKPHVVFDNALTNNDALTNTKETTNDVVVKANFVKPIGGSPAEIPTQIQVSATDADVNTVEIKHSTIRQQGQISKQVTATTISTLLPVQIQTQALQTAVAPAKESPITVLIDTTTPIALVESKIDIEIEQQFNPKERIIAKKALAKIPDTTQFIIISMLKAALLKGGIKSPMGYLNALVNKSITGELDITAFTTDKISIPANDFERQELRESKIRRVFDKHGDKIKADLIALGHIFIDGLGSVSKSEFETLGLIDKAPRTISGSSKSLSLTELMDIAEKQALAQAAREKQDKAHAADIARQQPRKVADIKVGVMSEKEIAARKMILELEAKLIATGEFTGANSMAISDIEIAELAELEAKEAQLLS